MEFSYELIHRKELEHYAEEMGLSLEETAHQLAIDHYFERGYNFEYIDAILGKEPKRWYMVFDAIVNADEYIKIHGETKPMNAFLLERP